MNTFCSSYILGTVLSIILLHLMACSKHALSNFVTFFLILQMKNLSRSEMTSLGQGHTASAASALFGLCEAEGTHIALF